MGLTSDLRHHSHPITRLVHAAFPRRADWISRVRALAASAPTAVPAASSARTVIGLAFELCMGLDLAQGRPYERLLSCLPPTHAAWVTEQPAGSVPELIKRGYYLGFFEDLLFKNPAAASYFLERSPHPADHLPLFAACEEELSQLWQLYEQHARPTLRAGRMVQLSPVLHTSPTSAWPYAVADLLIDSTLIEVKTGHCYENEDDLERALCQLMAYAALAQHHAIGVRTVALYLAQVGMLLTWPLEELVDRLSNELVDLSALGAALATAADA